MPYADTLGEKPAGISPLVHGKEYKHVNISWNQSIVEPTQVVYFSISCSIFDSLPEFILKIIGHLIN